MPRRIISSATPIVFKPTRRSRPCWSRFSSKKYGVASITLSKNRTE
ncbi:MAG: hypothetical protein HC853_19475 [Anaerolineae bacterium]|nr:hypothetical protein [Anaerolineae bacterium]